jgi:hypothetical protein
MEFEFPDKNNWKKKHKLVGIGLYLNSNIASLYLDTKTVKLTHDETRSRGNQIE